MIFCIIIIILLDVSDLQKGTIKKKSAKQANDGSVVQHESSPRRSVNNVRQNHAGLLLQVPRAGVCLLFSLCVCTLVLHSSFHLFQSGFLPSTLPPPGPELARKVAVSLENSTVFSGCAL